jgi:hypothetical protein
LLEADDTSGLLNDYAVYTIELAHPHLCNATFSTATANAPAWGFLATVTINADTDCTFQRCYQHVMDSARFRQLRFRPDRVNLPGSSKSDASQSQRCDIDWNCNPDDPPGWSRQQFLNEPVELQACCKTLDKLIFASSHPNQLYIYDPVTRNEQVVPLPLEPLSLSVGPNGLYAAVGHDGWISYVNLLTGSIEKVFEVDTDVHKIVLAGNGFIYAFPERDWSDIFSFEIASGTWTPASAIYNGRISRLHPSGKYLYVGGNWTSKWDITQGVARLINSPSPVNPYGGSCGNLWLSEDGNRLFTACGTTYRSSELPSDDFSYNGSLSAASAVSWVANSNQQHATAVIPSISSTGANSSGRDTEVQFYGDQYLWFIAQDALPSFTVDGDQYAGHGRYVTWNSSTTKLFVLLQADSQANLASDFAVYTLDASKALGSCTVSIDRFTTQLSRSGVTQSIKVTIPDSCHWVAQANVPWIRVDTSDRVGSGTVSLIITSNDGDQRRGTLTIAGQAFVITQEGIPQSCTASIAPFSTEADPSGRTEDVTVTLPQTCNWAAQTDVSWISIDTSSRLGSAVASFTIAAVRRGVAPSPLPVKRLSLRKKVFHRRRCQLSVKPQSSSPIPTRYSQDPISERQR